MTLEEKDPRRLFEGMLFNIELQLIIGDALIRRMVRLGLLKESEKKLDYVLGLTTG